MYTKEFLYKWIEENLPKEQVNGEEFNNADMIMFAHAYHNAKLKLLDIPIVSKHRDLLIAYELKNWEVSEATTQMVEQRVDDYLSNL